MKSYTKYKPSRIPYFKQLPDHWDVAGLDKVFQLRRELATDDDKLVSAFITGRVTLRENMKDSVIKSSGKELGYQKVRAGDFLISGMNAHIGGLGISDSDGKCSPVYLVYQPRDSIDSRYFSYLLRFISLSGYIGAISTTIRFNSADFKRDDAKQVYLCVPPLYEQQAITNFLDRKTAQIDRLIEEKKRQIELLQEQLAALINHTVTKGQNRNNVRQGSSPTPWLFTLPPGWQRQDLKYNTYMKGRIGYQNLHSDEYTEEGPYLVSSVHFKDGRIEWNKCNHVTRERFEMAPEIILQKHDVLFMKDGALMGKLAYVDNLPGDACLNSHLLLMRPLNNAYLPRFLFYVLMTDVFEAYMIQERNGTTFFGFSQQSMGNFPISRPPLDEQKQICNVLDEETEKTNFAIQKIEDTILRLQEYRTALISEAVTGKIDVREWKTVHE